MATIEELDARIKRDKAEKRRKLRVQKLKAAEHERADRLAFADTVLCHEAARFAGIDLVQRAAWVAAAISDKLDVTDGRRRESASATADAGSDGDPRPQRAVDSSPAWVSNGYAG
jgi:hypothetical protein